MELELEDLQTAATEDEIAAELPQRGHTKPFGHRQAVTAASHCASLPNRVVKCERLRPSWNWIGLRAMCRSSAPTIRISYQRLVAEPGHGWVISLKNGGRLLAKLAATHKGKKLRLFFRDEERIGQKGRTCRIWWTRGHARQGCANTASRPRE
jgi:hypothetical protein